MSPKPKPTLIQLLLLAQQNRCFYCEGAISFDRSCGWLRATVDHFYPKSRGGAKGIGNIVLACEGCNNRKRARQPRLHELLKWNKLAADWPHIDPVDLGPLVPQRPCKTCDRQIPVDRLLKTRLSLSQTQTCSPECARKRKNRSRKMRERQRRASSKASPKTPLPEHILAVSKGLQKHAP
jgi:hypothetical protein